MPKFKNSMPAKAFLALLSSGLLQSAITEKGSALEPLDGLGSAFGSKLLITPHRHPSDTCPILDESQWIYLKGKIVKICCNISSRKVSKSSNEKLIPSGSPCKASLNYCPLPRKYPCC